MTLRSALMWAAPADSTTAAPSTTVSASTAGGSAAQAASSTTLAATQSGTAATSAPTTAAPITAVTSTTVAHSSATTAVHAAGSGGATTLAPPDPSLAHLGFQFILAMIVIVVIMWIMVKLFNGKTAARARGIGPRSRPGQIQVLSRQQLAKGVSVALVHVAGKDLFVGITPAGVSLLSEVDLSTVLDDDGNALAAAGGVPSDDAIAAVSSMDRRALGGQWRASQLGGASPLQAWMAKLDQLREMTVRKS